MMNPEDLPLLRGAFEDLPSGRTSRIFGVQYAVLKLAPGDDLFVTRYGWHHFANILPEQWYTDRAYLHHGVRLPGSTGTVYRVPTQGAGSPMDLVVKFSRFAQDVPFGIEGTFPGHAPPEDLGDLDWNDPFEEFGMVFDLRRGRFGPPELKIRTKRPLCIFSPRERVPEWKLGRSESVFARHSHELDRDQEREHGSVRLHEERLYIMVYEWVKGLDAEQCCRRGLLDEKEMKEVTQRAARELSEKGFVALDHKPRHVILRPRHKSGDLLRDHAGRLAYTLIDFELLRRRRVYMAWLRGSSRNRI
jgi:hypothetical protein